MVREASPYGCRQAIMYTVAENTAECCYTDFAQMMAIMGLGDTQRQAQELISGQSLGAKAKFLSFNL